MKNLATGSMALCFLVAASSANAATITWGAATNITADSDISTNGNLEYAIHYGGTDSTINGVSFVAPSASTVVASVGLATNGNVGAQASLSAAYQNLVKGNWYTSKNQAVTLQSLTLGTTYEVQIWVADARYGPSNYTGIVGGPNLYVNAQPGGGGQYAIGTFVADGSTQGINFTAGDGVVNAIQVRSAVPEPGSLALLGMGVLATLRRRR